MLVDMYGSRAEEFFPDSCCANRYDQYMHWYRQKEHKHRLFPMGSIQRDRVTLNICNRSNKCDTCYNHLVSRMAWNVSNMTKPLSVSSSKARGCMAFDHTAMASLEQYSVLAEKPLRIIFCRETTQCPSASNSDVGGGGSDIMN
jgi:hypothetical protein